MRKTRVYTEKRIQLSSPEEIRKGDSLQRNSEPIHTVEIVGDKALVKDRWYTTELPADAPVFVWRVTWENSCSNGCDGARSA